MHKEDKSPLVIPLEGIKCTFDEVPLDIVKVSICPHKLFLEVVPVFWCCCHLSHAGEEITADDFLQISKCRWAVVKCGFPYVVLGELCLNIGFGGTITVNIVLFCSCKLVVWFRILVSLDRQVLEQRKDQWQ